MLTLYGSISSLRSNILLTKVLEMGVLEVMVNIYFEPFIASKLTIKILNIDFIVCI